jgi:hypothetical protein
MANPNGIPSPLGSCLAGLSRSYVWSITAALLSFANIALNQQMVASILFLAMFMTRRRGFRIFGERSKIRSGYLDSPTSNDSSDRLLSYDSDVDGEYEGFAGTTKYPPKNRNCCGTVIPMPNTSRFRNNIHSRMLQRYPFLIEMFYWVINYAFYRFTSVASQRIFAKTGIWNVAQDHGLAVLEAEEYSFLSFLFPIRERNVQQWFMRDHQDALTVLNKAYALIHIPGTVG